MKLTTFTLSALLGLASASAIPLTSSTTSALVPNITPSLPDFTPTLVNTTEATGPSPIDFHACSGFDAANSLFDIQEVTIDPKPIKKRQDVHIVTRGQLKRKVGQGAAVAINIIKGNKRHQLDYDFCKGIQSGCPVEPGAVEWWTGQHISGLVSSLCTSVAGATAV